MEKEFLERLEKIEKALSFSLNSKVENEWRKNSFGNLNEAVKPLFIQNLIEPNENLIKLGGKRWRPLLMILVYEMEKAKHPESAISEDLVYSLTPLVEFVHTASLIHDDIEDSADLRRGKPAAHIQYGIDVALNAASWLYFEAPVCINNPKFSQSLQIKLYNIYTMELRRLHLGQAMDIYWHREPEVFPLMEEYFSMVQCKTGTLASLAMKVGAIAGGASEEEAEKLCKIAADIGIGFQIIDDVINLTTGNPGKKRGDDIVEGKKSLPVLIHVNKNPQDKQKISEYMTTAAKEGINSPAVEECIKLLESSNCIEEALQKGICYIKDNCGLLGSEPIQKLFFSMIPEYL